MEKERQRSARNRRVTSLAGRDIGRLPPVKNPKRKQQALQSLEFYLATYFPLTFSKPFCPDHRRVIGKIEGITLRGGLLAMAMPRGMGKTQICIRTALWALKIGRHKFVCLIGATETDAEGMLDTLKSEIET